MTPEQITLAELQTGKSGMVVEVKGDDSIALRMMEMGVTPGCTATVVGTAPMGDPIEIMIRHYRLSLRKTEATRVTIEPIS